MKTTKVELNAVALCVLKKEYSYTRAKVQKVNDAEGQRFRRLKV